MTATTIGYVPRAPRQVLPDYGHGDAEAVLVAPAPWVTVRLASCITGFTEPAIRAKIAKGVWIEGAQWRRAPDGTILISMEGYRKWVEQAPASRSAQTRSA